MIHVLVSFIFNLCTTLLWGVSRPMCFTLQIHHGRGVLLGSTPPCRQMVFRLRRHSDKLLFPKCNEQRSGLSEKEKASQRAIDDRVPHQLRVVPVRIQYEASNTAC